MKMRNKEMTVEANFNLNFSFAVTLALYFKCASHFKSPVTFFLSGTRNAISILLSFTWKCHFFEKLPI